MEGEKMKGIVSGIRFILFYATFLFFFILIAGLGGVKYIASNYICNETLNITSNCLNTTVTLPPPPSSDPLSSLFYIVDNIGLLFTLMVVNPFAPEVALLWVIIGVPAIIVLIYIVLTLIRGGGA